MFCVPHPTSENGQINGEVLVYRNPGLHFGDIHVLTAKYVEDLVPVVRNAKYGIFFSCKGPRSVADEIAGGDFDGDMYWVSRNSQVKTHSTSNFYHLMLAHAFFL